MKIFADKLADHLKKTLSPVYYLAGDEPLQMKEASDAIRHAARTSGAEEREVYHVDNSFSWSQLQESSASLSLFSSRKLIELHLPSGKPGQEGSLALQGYAKEISAQQGKSDNVLLIISGKLDSAASNSKWFKALDAVGIYIPIWPLDHQKLPGWITHRLRSAGFQPTPEAVSLLAQRVEGNLLACDQEIQKLRLAYPEQKSLNDDDILTAVQDSSRYDIFNLTDALLAADPVRSMRILDGLEGEGLESPVILWGVTRELRQLITLKHRTDQGQSFDRICKELRIWDKRKPLYRTALSRHGLHQLHQMILHAQQIDQRIKGLQKGSSWTLLRQLCLQLSGLRLPEQTSASRTSYI